MIKPFPDIHIPDIDTAEGTSGPPRGGTISRSPVSLRLVTTTPPGIRQQLGTALVVVGALLFCVGAWTTIAALLLTLGLVPCFAGLAALALGGLMAAVGAVIL